MEHIALRDYLRQHEAARDEYARIKQDLAKQDLAKRHRTDIDAYVDGKTAFIQRILWKMNV